MANAMLEVSFLMTFWICVEFLGNFVA